MNWRSIIILCGILCTTLIICGVLFWPTLYRYDKIRFGKNELIVRANRLTGYAEILSSEGWKKLRSENDIQPLPRNDIAKMIIKGCFDGKGKYKFAIYNGTEFTIKKIRLSIKAIGKRQWQRIYEEAVDIPPFSKVSSYIELIDFAPWTPCERGVDLDEDLLRRSLPPGWVLLEQEVEPEVRIEEIYGYQGE